ncbi:MAG: hypothetical protein DRJ05_09065 [Bacteroidetes bacterium]|nr:MAG: hypothetical protein DRJ05_09065 [Bacteroidota bacterium]
MEIRKYKLVLAILVLTTILSSCINEKETYTIDSISNYNDTVIYFDYTNTINTGFIVPSKSQTVSGYFELDFEITNKTDKATKYFYKIYYQNESYKFDEKNWDGSINPLCEENFYGSYEDVGIGFKTTKELGENEKLSITDSIRIAGNPRNEEKYFGSPIRYFKTASKEQIAVRVEEIRNSKDWYANIVKKAKNNGSTIENQLWLDAEYIINYRKSKGEGNNRWKRNVRTGNYTFMVVVLPEKTFHQIPDYIKSIDKQDEGRYVNPFYYFKYGDGRKLENTNILELANQLAVKAKLPLANGVWSPRKNNMGEYFDTTYYSATINNSKELFDKAPFKIYGNYRPDLTISNVPVIADFFGKGYTMEEYENNSAIPEDERKEVVFANSITPGKNIKTDTVNGFIKLSNPGCTEDDMRKENVGIIARHGMTYGKYTIKAKMTEQLTTDNVWNGITNAIWMATESLEGWNARRICEGEGYMPFYGAGKEEPRVPRISYSEIDFEIVKAAETWPGFSYKNRKEREEPKSNIDKVMVTCTNWDMACKQPDKFHTGAREIDYKGHTFLPNRWHEHYNAITQKTPVSDDELFKSDYYYFQIEWKPTEIIWRVGPEKDNLRIVGYLNDEVTNIPNNQMLLIFTQEYHYSAWWPKSPFKQENIPFPAKDMNGYIYEVTIE